MPQYRKRPVVIEAVQNVPDAHTPEWFRAAVLSGAIRPQPGDGFAIDTLEGRMIALPGDWIIRGVKGEFYPCKPDIFAATYEPANAPDPRDAEIAALRAEVERLRGALEHYGKEMCEGFCLEYGPNFDEDTCSGCRARRALAGGGA